VADRSRDTYGAGTRKTGQKTVCAQPEQSVPVSDTREVVYTVSDTVSYPYLYLYQPSLLMGVEMQGAGGCRRMHN
jgi:hypothetical protein